MEEAINSHVYATITLFGNEIPFITDAVIVTWVIMAVVMLLAFLGTRKLETVPKGPQIVVEWLVGFVNNLCREQIGHHWRTFAPYLGTVLIYLACANVIGLFNILPSGSALAALFGNAHWEHYAISLHPPTRNFNVTVCLALISVFLTFWAEFRFKGGKGVLRSFYKPTPVSGFIKVLDMFVRPLSLCLRLFGNIVGATIVMTLVYSALPLIFPAAVAMYFEVFDGLLQAYVFVFLTMIYLAEATETEEEQA